MAEEETQAGDAGADVTPGAGEGDGDYGGLIDALMNLSGDSGEESAAGEAGDGGAGDGDSSAGEGDGGDGGGDAEAERSPLEARFYKEDGSFDSEAALDAIRELGSLHSQASRNLSERNAYVAALESRLKSAGAPEEGVGAGPGEQAAGKSPAVKLPEGFEGSLGQEDLDVLTDAVANAVMHKLEASREALEQQQGDLIQEAQLARGRDFVDSTNGLYRNFQSTYRVDDETFSKVKEMLSSDEDLNSASEKYVLQGGAYPEELLKNKMLQAYGKLSQTGMEAQKSSTGDADAIADAVLAKLGISKESLARQASENVSRETHHPLRGETQTGSGEEAEEDFVDLYFKEQGMDVDPELKDLLRLMDESVPN